MDKSNLMPLDEIARIESAVRNDGYLGSTELMRLAATARWAHKLLSHLEHMEKERGYM